MKKCFHLLLLTALLLFLAASALWAQRKMTEVQNHA